MHFRRDRSPGKNRRREAGSRRQEQEAGAGDRSRRREEKLIGHWSFSIYQFPFGLPLDGVAPFDVRLGTATYRLLLLLQRIPFIKEN